MPVFNYLTGITGFKEGDLDAGESLEVVLKKVWVGAGVKWVGGWMGKVNMYAVHHCRP